MLKNNPFKACLLISTIIFCLSLNNASAEPCYQTFSTMTETVQYPVCSPGHWEVISDTCEMPIPPSEWHVDIGPLNYIYPITGEVILRGKRQYHKQRLFVNAQVVGAYDTEAECDAARFSNCGASYESPCMPFPSSIALVAEGGGWQGTYDYCEGTRRFPKACQENSYGQWGYISAWLETTPTQIGIKYYEWECP